MRTSRVLREALAFQVRQLFGDGWRVDWGRDACSHDGGGEQECEEGWDVHGEVVVGGRKRHASESEPCSEAVRDHVVTSPLVFDWRAVLERKQNTIKSQWTIQSAESSNKIRVRKRDWRL